MRKRSYMKQLTTGALRALFLFPPLYAPLSSEFQIFLAKRSTFEKAKSKPSNQERDGRRGDALSYITYKLKAARAKK
jgi:hypothetical protein